MRFFLLFPSPSPLDQKAPWLKTVFLWLNLALVTRELALFAATLYSFHWAAVLGRYLRWPTQIDVAFILVVLAIGVTSLVLQTVRARNRDERRRMLILLGGTLISVLPLRTIEYTGICRAARGVGGDYYDFIALGPGTLGIALADVSGKGISAALLMANLQAMLRSLAPQRHLAVEWLAADINRQLCHSTASAKYATFFYGVYRDEDRSFCYVNAGHNPALLLRLSPGPGEVLATASPGTAPAPAGRAEELGASGVPVGLFPETIYDKGVVTIHPGEVLVIYTDGVSEAMNTAGEEFGEERLLEVITAARDLDPEAIKKRVLESVDAFVGNAEPSDDITLVIVRGV